VIITYFALVLLLFVIVNQVDPQSKQLMATVVIIISMTSFTKKHSANSVAMLIVDMLVTIIVEAAGSINFMVSKSISYFKYMFIKATKWIGSCYSIITMITMNTTVNSMDKIITTTNIIILVVVIVTVQQVWS